jgi:predicted phosphoribosyltransferase
MTLYADRQHAGRILASSLREYAGRTNLVIYALPRGGVPVGYEVAIELAAPLDVFVVRKIGVPGREELAMGAIASGGHCVINDDVVQSFDISKNEIVRAVRAEKRELARREFAYRGARPAVNVMGKVVLLIDDGMATGASMRAAIRALRQLSPTQIIAAVPVAASDTCDAMADEADDVVCLATPEPFSAVGLWYEDFSPTTDREVRELLASTGGFAPGAGTRRLAASFAH